MSENILAGLEFAIRLPNFPTYSKPLSYQNKWEPWVPTDASLIKFEGPIKFRAAQKITYPLIIATDNIYRDQICDTFEQAQRVITNEVSKGNRVTVHKKTEQPDLSEVIKGRKLQYRVIPNSRVVVPEWFDVTGMSSELEFSTGVQFRIRPDHYHVVDTNDSLIKGSVVFHDIEDLAKYVDNRLRTSGLNFSVTKVKY